MDYIALFLNYLVLFVLVLIGVAFITLMEQNVLGNIQIRLGPNKVGYSGLLQPFADAVKLFNKENMVLRTSNNMMYYFCPTMGLMLALLVWLIYPFTTGGFDFSLTLLFFVCVSSLGVYPILGGGWASNCKYTMLGSLRAVAQMISYEVSLMMVLLSIFFLSGGLKFSIISDSQSSGLFVFLCFPLCLIWFASSLAETNRTPYDFAEGESELVSGFNTEYSAGCFTLIFMAEYANILFMGLLFSILFFGNLILSVFTILVGLLVVFWFIWVRGTMPRFRYDKLMNLAWKSFLPISLWVFIYYIFISLL